MACSRTPKWMVRPKGPSPSACARAVGRKEGSPAILVLFEPARSDDPPHSSGTTFANAESTLPDAARVARDWPTSQVGRAA